MSIDEAVAELERGALVAFPTETVYGLGADASNSEAIQALYAAKGRPADHPVIVHLASIEALDDVAMHVPDWARVLARKFWPGPLTLVVQRRPGSVCDEVTGGRPTVGVRVPAHPIALDLLSKFGRGVAAPSANRFGRVSPTTAEHVRADLGDEVAVVLDGGPCAVGVESTIVDATGSAPQILRLGGISVGEIETVLGRAVAVANSGEIAAPGTLPSHYAPSCRVELATAQEVATRARAASATGASVAVLALASTQLLLPDNVVRLPSPATTDAYGQQLFARLREADALHVDLLLVVPPGPEGVGAAVIDRLRRAATVSK